MYIQITTRCNMHCEHCCSSCTEEGEDMSMEVLKKAIEISSGNQICIGGGEPTLHPRFKEMLLDTIAASDEDVRMWIAINGSNKELSLLLAKLSCHGVISAALSYDDFHDIELVDDEVLGAFENLVLNHKAEIRKATLLRPIGRARVNQESLEDRGWNFEDGCICPDFSIKPDGRVFQCGCEDSPCIGDVWTWNGYGGTGCWKDMEKEKEVC
jgi:organic radical activating enzyme